MNWVSWVLLAMAVASSIIITWFMYLAATVVSHAVQRPGRGIWRQFGLQMLIFIVFTGSIYLVGAVWSMVLA